MTTKLFSFSKLFLLCFFGFFCNVCAQDSVLSEDLRATVIKQLISLEELLHSVEADVLDCKIKCADKQEFMGHVNLLEQMINRVVSGAAQQDDFESLKSLCVMSSVMFECVEWLVKGGGAKPACLDLDSILADSFPYSLEQLQQIGQENEQSYQKLLQIVDLAKASWYSYAMKKLKNYAKAVSGFPLGTKLLAVAGVNSLIVYLFYRKSDSQEQKSKGENLVEELSERSDIKEDEVEITTENLFSLAPKMPSELELKLKQWLDANPKVWKTLVEQEGSFEDWREKHVAGWSLLQGMGVRIHSRNGVNFIFTPQEFPGWLVKISGPVNRGCLQVANQDKQYGRFDLVDTQQLVPTYQTASRIHGHMQIQEAIELYGLTEIEVSEAYLYSLDGSCEDEHCLVIEKEFGENYVRLSDCYDELSSDSYGVLEEDLTEEVIKQLLIAAKHANLWNLTRDNIMVNLNSSKIVIVDAEQPNTTKLRDVFTKNERRKNYLACCACQSLYDVIPEDLAEQRGYVEKFARDDQEVMSAYNVRDLLKKFPEEED